MTTDPTIATAVDKGLGKVLIDMRTEAGTAQALGGALPGRVHVHGLRLRAKPTRRRCRSSSTRSSRRCAGSTRTPAQIAAKMPTDYYGGGGKSSAVHQGLRADVHPRRRDAAGRPGDRARGARLLRDPVKAKRHDIDLARPTPRSSPRPPRRTPGRDHSPTRPQVSPGARGNLRLIHPGLPYAARERLWCDPAAPPCCRDPTNRKTHGTQPRRRHPQAGSTRP